ncbi:MAG: BrnT family toxin [Bacteroidota bacterium]
MRFEWDDEKNKRNQEKHKIDFEEAKTIFSDDSSIEFEASRNDEYRVIRIGKTATKFILFVVYTMRGLVIRLISARQANKKERKLYIERKLKAKDDESTNS